MKQTQFEAAHAGAWSAFEAWLARDGKRKRASAPSPATDVDALPDAAVPQRYRVICQHLALARERGYDANLVDRLNALALRGHRLLYGARTASHERILNFIAADFPRAVRAERTFVLAAAVLLFAPAVLLFLATGPFPELVYYILSPAQVKQIEAMYSPDALHLGRTRDADSAAYMFGTYIWNNVRIGFQTFAGGLVFGLGSVVALLFNAVFIGTIAGHLSHNGYAVAFWSFVPGHSAFELIAIALTGAAGLRLGAALVAPGLRSRRAALVAAGRRAAPVMYGASTMLVLAALIEAFWSSLSTLDPRLKWTVGAVLWGVTLLYFIFAGRARGA